MILNFVSLCRLDVLEGEIFLQNLPSVVAARVLGMNIIFKLAKFSNLWQYGCFLKVLSHFLSDIMSFAV